MIILFYPGAGGNRYLQKLLGKEWTTRHTSYDYKNFEQLFSHRYFLDTQLTLPINSTAILTHCMNIDAIKKINVSPITLIQSDLKKSLRREWALHGHDRFINKLKNIKSDMPKLEHYENFKDPEWPVIITADQILTLPDYIQQEVNDNYNKMINQQNNTESILFKLKEKYTNKIDSAYEIISWHIDYYRDLVDFSFADKVVNIENDDDEFCSFMRDELEYYQSDLFDEVFAEIIANKKS